MQLPKKRITLFVHDFNKRHRFGHYQMMNWDRLIQPLGEGTFDTCKLAKLVKDVGYEGLFGLQCYNIKQDCEVELSKSM